MELCQIAGFLAGVVWTCLGMAVLAGLDPDGEHDTWVMGGSDIQDTSIVRFGLTLLFWPAAAATILWARYRR